MKTPPPPSDCNCASVLAQFSRRDFIKAGVTSTAALATGALAPGLSAAPKKVISETLVGTLFQSLSDEQRQAVCFPFDHPLRQKVDNNWHITDKRLHDFFSPGQQQMVKEIFNGLHSPEYAERVMKQVEHDSGKAGFGSSSIALFGAPGSGKFEFVLTGRHCTRRCDGDSVEGAAFGGPIFYGHAAADSDEETAAHPGNAYWSQAVQANEVFKMLDGKQRETALLGTARKERGTETVKLQGKAEGLPGIPVSDLPMTKKARSEKPWRRSWPRSARRTLWKP